MNRPDATRPATPSIRPGGGRTASAWVAAALLPLLVLAGCNPYGSGSGGDSGGGKLDATLHAGVVVPGYTGTRHDPAAQLIDPDWRSMSIYVFPADLDGEVHELHLSGGTTQGSITGLEPDVMYGVEVRVEVDPLGGVGEHVFERPTEDLILPVTLVEGDNHLTLTLLRGHWVFDEPVVLENVVLAGGNTVNLKGFSLVQMGQPSLAYSEPLISLNGARPSHNVYRVLWHYESLNELDHPVLNKGGSVAAIECGYNNRMACAFHVPGYYGIDKGVGLFGGMLPLADVSSTGDGGFEYISRSVGFLEPLQIVDGATLQGHLAELVVADTVIADGIDDEDCPPGYLLFSENDTTIRNYRHPADGDCMKETHDTVISHSVRAKGHPISISTDPFGLNRGDLRPMMEQASADWRGEVVGSLTIFGDYYDLGVNGEQDGQSWSGDRPPAAANESRLTNGQWLYFLLVADRGACPDAACFVIERMRFDLASNQWVAQEHVLSGSLYDYGVDATVGDLTFTTTESRPLLAVGGHLRLTDEDGEHYSVLEAKAIDLGTFFWGDDLSRLLYPELTGISCASSDPILQQDMYYQYHPTVCGMIARGGPIMDKEGYGPKDRTGDLGGAWSYCLGASPQRVEFDSSDLAIVAPVSEDYRRGFIVPLLNGSAMDKVLGTLLDCPS